jgi:hypothetical protein
MAMGFLSKSNYPFPDREHRLRLREQEVDHLERVGNVVVELIFEWAAAVPGGVVNGVGILRGSQRPNVGVEIW